MRRASDRRWARDLTAKSSLAQRPGRRATLAAERRPRIQAAARRSWQPDGLEDARPAQDELGRGGGAERVDNGAAEDLVHEALLEKPHFSLRRVDVHVHPVGRERSMNRWTSGLRSLIVATL